MVGNLEAAAHRYGSRTLAAVVGLGATQIAGWGSTFSPLTIFADDIGRDLALPREAVFTGITVMLLTSAVFATRVGRFVDRHGARAVMMAGSVVAALGMLVMAGAAGYARYLLAWTVMGLAMPLMLSNTAYPGLVQVVGPNARRAITGMSLIGGLTSSVFLPLNGWLLATIGWRDAYLVFAAIHIGICLPIHWWVLRPAPAADRDGLRGGAPSETPLDPRQRRLAFTLIALWSCAEGLITWGLYIQAIDIFRALGLATTTAIGIWALIGPTQAAARLGELLSGGRHSVLSMAVAAAAFGAASFFFLLPFGVSVTSAVLFTLCLGIGHGLFAIARNTLPLMLFGVREYATYMGRLSVPQQIANALAPILFAAVISRVGAAYALWLSAAVSLTGLGAVVMLYRLCPPPGEARS